MKLLRVLAATGLVLAMLASDAHATDPSPSIIYVGAVHVLEGHWVGAPVLFASTQLPKPSDTISGIPAVSYITMPRHTWEETGNYVVRLCMTGPVQTGHGATVNYLLLGTPPA